jgi:3-oxoadipate enol-lactonase
VPFVELDGLRVHYSLTGLPAAPAGPVLALSNSLGTNFSMWDAQLPEFEKHFRVLRYDTRGHGQTSVAPGPYAIAQLGGDVLHLLDALKIDRFNFCGLSMGGQIGMWLGVDAAPRLHKLVLCNTTPKIGTPETWNIRIEAIRKNGMKAVAPGIIERWLTPEFRQRSPQGAAAMLHMLEHSPIDGYLACCAAVRDFDARKQLANIRTPTLAIGGTHDPATPAEDVRALAQSIPGARYVELPTSHLSNVEAPEQFTKTVVEFLTT